MNDHQASWAPLLQQMASSATEDVTAGLRRLAQLFQNDDEAIEHLGSLTRQALAQMGQTYRAFATEVRELATLREATLSGSFVRFQRVRLVARIHGTRGDAVFVRRISQSLARDVDRPSALVASAVLERWANREVHLFGWLVPLALYVEQLMTALTHEPTPAARARHLAASREQLRPVWRMLCLTLHQLQQLSFEIESASTEGTSVAMPARISTERSLLASKHSGGTVPHLSSCWERS